MARRALAILIFFCVGGAAAWLWYAWPGLHRPATSPASAPVAAVAPPAASVAEPAAPRILHPVEAIAASDATPVPAPSIGQAIAALVGQKAAKRFLQDDDFAHRFVATVDNLGRDQASPALWPVQPTPDRFLVRGAPGDLTIDPDNGLRYAPFVILVESVDPRRTVALYRRIYPALQQAYEDLGFPGRYFNDRVVAVLDLLLATPEPTGPIHVRLPEANGPVQPTRPWLLYEFTDPAYQHLAAGQRILLRMGAVDERRLKARLGTLRALLVGEPEPSAR